MHGESSIYFGYHDIHGDQCEKAIHNSHGNTEQSAVSSEGIYYLDANNLYGLAMHRMMPYELVGVPERQEVMEKINRDPNGWVQSLKTFGKYGFFIECDIEAPVELHGNFNDCHSSPYRRWACIPMESRSTLRRTTSWTK